MARTDDYVNAFKIAAAEIAAKDPRDISRKAGVDYDEGRKCFAFEFIGRPIEVTFPDCLISPVQGGDEVPLTEQVLILHYLNQADGTPEQDEPITYREVPSGEFYFPAFFKRAEAPLLKTFGLKPELLPLAAPELKGSPLEGHGDTAAVFRPLPMVPVTLVIWAGDDEFEPTAKILFDRSIPHYLTTEDIAWVSGMIVYRLMRLASKVNGG